jgi:hypothetical protein
LVQLLRISKNDRIDFQEFRKKAGTVAGNLKKSSDRFLGIPEKSRHSCWEFQKMGGIVYGPHDRNPRIFSTISDGSVSPAIAGAEKRMTRLLSISKNDRIDS